MFNGDPRRTSHTSCLKMNFFLHGADVCYIFLSTGLSRKNIYIKEYAFFDRAHSTKYMHEPKR